MHTTFAKRGSRSCPCRFSPFTRLPSLLIPMGTGTCGAALSADHARLWRAMLRRVIATTAITALAVFFAARELPAQTGAEVRFNRDIRPIMSDTCLKCHGPGTHKAGLRLDLRDEAVKKAESGATPLVPGKPDQSEIVRRVMSSDADEVMPPPSSN